MKKEEWKNRKFTLRKTKITLPYLTLLKKEER